MLLTPRGGGVNGAAGQADEPAKLLLVTGGRYAGSCDLPDERLDPPLMRRLVSTEMTPCGSLRHSGISVVIVSTTSRASAGSPLETDPSHAAGSTGHLICGGTRPAPGAVLLVSLFSQAEERAQ